MVSTIYFTGQLNKAIFERTKLTDSKVLLQEFTKERKFSSDLRDVARSL